MPPGKYGMQEEWEKEGDQGIDMDFLLPTGIILKFAVSRNDTIKTIKKVRSCSCFFSCSGGQVDAADVMQLQSFLQDGS